MTDVADSYPGARASAAHLLLLAEEYRHAAEAVAGQARKGVAISRAPYRLVSIHAIELYLNALLLHAGLGAGDIRKLKHDLAARTDLALDRGLLLRRKTADHLKALAASREYLISRYDPELSATLSNPTRLEATLNEVAAKVRARLS